jgi:hypothetical protein
MTRAATTPVTAETGNVVENNAEYNATQPLYNGFDEYGNYIGDGSEAYYYGMNGYSYDGTNAAPLQKREDGGLDIQVLPNYVPNLVLPGLVRRDVEEDESLVELPGLEILPEYQPSLDDSNTDALDARFGRVQKRDYHTLMDNVVKKLLSEDVIAMNVQPAPDTQPPRPTQPVQPQRTDAVGPLSGISTVPTHRAPSPDEYRGMYANDEYIGYGYEPYGGYEQGMPDMPDMPGMPGMPGMGGYDMPMGMW